MKLSVHFELEELVWNSHGLANDCPADVILLLLEFWEKFLEQLRAPWGGPSRSQAAIARRNSIDSWAVHPTATIAPHPHAGPRTSGLPGICLGQVFKWVCEESGLMFDKVILDRGKRPSMETDDCIHIQYRAHNPRRLAFDGSAHQGDCTPVGVKA